MRDLHELPAARQSLLLRSGTLSACELVDHYLERIRSVDPELHAFTSVTEDAAWLRARAVDALPDEARGPLHGLVLADKDLVARAGVVTGRGSRLHDAQPASEDDAVIVVLDGAGGVSVGKTATPEYGMYGYTEPFGAPLPRNPWDRSLSPGGSSGGAAVAVAAGLVSAATGTDGGGSVRIPAAATGLVGLKPGRGVVPVDRMRVGRLPLVSTGPLARTAADAALVYSALHGGIPVPLADPPRLRVGMTTDSPWDATHPVVVSPEAREAVEIAARALAAAGHEVVPFHLPEQDAYGPAFRDLWALLAAAIPATGEEQLALLEPITRTLLERGRALDEAARDTLFGTLEGLNGLFRGRFADVDLVLTPSLALTPRPLGWYDAVDPGRNFDQQVFYSPFTSFVNVTGLPAITLPVAETTAGLPMGAQLIGRDGDENLLLALAAQLEGPNGWADRRPPGL